MSESLGLNFEIVNKVVAVSQTHAATTNLVVVHGFGPLIDTSWLSNLLLPDLPCARILEFGVNASAFDSIECFGKEADRFLEALVSHTSVTNDVSYSRRIVAFFELSIWHSLPVFRNAELDSGNPIVC